MFGNLLIVMVITRRLLINPEFILIIYGQFLEIGIVLFVSDD